MIIAATRYGSASGSSGGKIPVYSYTGAKPEEHKAETGDNWEMVFLGSGTITFTKDVDVDVFVVGGGMSGSQGGDAWAGVPEDNYINSFAYGGDGGDGGGCTTAANVHLTANTAYPVTVGDAGVESTAFGYSAAAGAGATGGAGASSTNSGNVGGNGGDGQYAFGDPNTLYEPGRKYGAGGGGGAASSNLAPQGPGTGGATGGGNGGPNTNDGDGSPGLANTGAGGGGGRRAIYFARAGGLGGSGIVIIRNARNST